jgi:hypothetical protein
VYPGDTTPWSLEETHELRGGLEHKVLSQEELIVEVDELRKKFLVVCIIFVIKTLNQNFLLKTS